VPGSAVKAVRAEADLELPVAALFAWLADVSSHGGRMPPIVSVRSLRSDAAGDVYHMVIDPPVVARRDYCLRVTLSRSPDGGYRSDFDTVEAGCPPPQRGMVRMTRNHGHWQLVPLAPNRTRVVYEGFSDPAGALPAWVVNRLAARGIVSSFAALARAARDPRYSACGDDLRACPFIHATVTAAR
jgi:hypothetical protein